ncbi:hypothetical protein [Clostridium sp. E02]|uniref:hypothetical protein n=1 Tax=Clostridium sp. E02 TaxID=2487134 RepID=UPI000F52E3B0|nr:hypothetical protein [Clostridium sp. E02]
MKKKYLLLVVACLLLTGCNNEKLNAENQSVISQSAGGSETRISEHDPVESDEATVDGSDGQIEDQSFDINLSGWGDVTFASFMPEEARNKDEDVMFMLLNGDKEVYRFPGITEDNHRIGQSFQKIDAIAFKDYDEDGRKDIIIINEYSLQPGDPKENYYREARVYHQEDEGKEFRIDNHLVEYLNNYYYNDTIESVMKGIKKYREKSETNFYGDYQITACRGTATAYALSQEEIDAVIGSSLNYQANSFNTMAAGYEEETYPTDRLYEDFRVKPTDLGITKKEVTVVSVLLEGDFIGGYFYILDENTLLVYYEGVFFEAKKTSENHSKE